MDNISIIGATAFGRYFVLCRGQGDRYDAWREKRREEEEEKRRERRQEERRREREKERERERESERERVVHAGKALG